MGAAEPPSKNDLIVRFDAILNGHMEFRKGLMCRLKNRNGVFDVLTCGKRWSTSKNQKDIGLRYDIYKKLIR
jgi:hypothetical protein